MNPMRKLLETRDVIQNLGMGGECFKAWLTAQMYEGTEYFQRIIEPAAIRSKCATTPDDYDNAERDWRNIYYVYKTSVKEVKNE